MDATASEQKREQREEPAPEEEQRVFGFLEEISLSPKKQPEKSGTSPRLLNKTRRIVGELL